ncbi:MAG: M12 family metallo-peptidase [Planctomycetota bacterium]|jgi:hypothetical protein
MVRPALLLRVSFLGAMLLAGPLEAQQLRPFPLRAQHATDGSIVELVPQLDELAALQALDDVRLVDVPWPDGEALAVDLSRVAIATAGAVLFVDGRPAPARSLDESITLWTGRVVGDPGSEVYLAFSPFGSQGWIRHAGRLEHLITEPGRAPRWISEAHIGAPQTPFCGLDRLTGVHGAPAPRPLLAPPADGGPAFTLEAQIAIETDTQYFDLFGDVDAARAYALSLLGAVSARYREQVDVVLSVPYLGLYTGADPWTSQDNGGSSIDVLFEFQDAWDAGGAPVEADLYHLISGGELGGGVAYLSVLCDQDFGFAVSGNLGAETPIPIAVGPLNWDFVVVAHETGHNFGAVHTHDYCPPVDECAPDGYFGGCQSSQVCTTEGTIMSYCHLCDGGFLNETTYFHPQSAADMRADAESSCLQLFSGLITADLGFAKPGSGGTPALVMSGSPDPDSVHLSITSAPSTTSGVLFLSTATLNVPFKGGTLVPADQFIVPLSSSPAGTVALSAPLGFPGLWGVTLYAQAWLADGGSLTATNGLSARFVVP